jgi:biopolymer transport protein ExbB
MFELIANYLDISVFTVLGVMSVISLGVVVERAIFYRSVQIQRYSILESLKLDLQNGLSTIAIVATNAPYVGLLGTVFGIMLTFYDIGQTGQVDVNTVMVGLALALKATALGLAVAIPSMIFYNVLVAKSERIIAHWIISAKAQPQLSGWDDTKQ